MSDLTSKRGIPSMEVVEDVESWLTKEKMSVEEAVKIMDEKYKKYKYIENSMRQQKHRLDEKIPEFQNSLGILSVLEQKKEKGEPFETTFLLAEEVYSKAKVTNPEKVGIWLGANVMVEYELEKAREILEKNKNTVDSQISELTVELDYVKDQITTTEVNIAHIYNYGIRKRQEAASA
ncbi:unnamed protein product [Auanema sp. JU1783]|nr:unnamed protein product [Auanema sp. JU1783]